MQQIQLKKNVSVCCLNNLKLYKTKAVTVKNICIQEKFILWLTFNPGLALQVAGARV